MRCRIDDRQVERRTLLRAVSGVAAGGTLAGCAGRARRAEVIDDFESGDLSSYTRVDPASGDDPAEDSDPDSWGLSRQRAVQGDRALYTTDEGYYSLLSMPGDGLSRYPKPGDTIRGYAGVGRADNVSVVLGLQDIELDSKPVGYHFTISHHNGDIRIQKGGPEGTQRLSSAESRITSGTYKMTIRWEESGRLNLDVTPPDDETGEVRVTATDGTFDIGGFGFRVGTYRGSVRAWFDDWRIVPSDRQR